MLSAPPVGFVGVGRMGGSMAKHLLRADYQLTVYDVSSEAATALAAEGARVAPAPRGVAEQSQVVLVMVVDDDQTRTVVAGAGGLLEGARPGSRVVLCSSLRPSTVRDLAALCAAREVGLLDAPVTGGEPGAAAGKLTFLVGGSEADVRAVQPVLQAMAERVVHVGGIGAGQVAKTVHNGLLWAQVAAVGEMLELARLEGVSLDPLRDALRGTPGDNRPLQRWEDFARNPWALKDLEATIAIAHAHNAQLPAIELVYQLFASNAVKLPAPAGR